eukprot:1396946-Amphidinium_carterae.1
MYHSDSEAGHAILGAMMNDYDVVSKISIVPRGPAGGVTIFMPSEDCFGDVHAIEAELKKYYITVCVSKDGKILIYSITVYCQDGLVILT